jgi:HEAT repeat protein
MGRAEAIPALLEVLHSDDLINSFTASESHKKEPVAKDAMVEIGTFYHEIRDLRCAVVWALGQLGDSSAIPDLIEVMKTDPDPRVCDVAVEALQQLGTPPAIVAIQQWHQQDTKSKQD